MLTCAFAEAFSHLLHSEFEHFTGLGPQFCGSPGSSRYFCGMTAGCSLAAVGGEVSCVVF